MAKHRGPRYNSSYSFLLEERIEVPYHVVGYADWLERAIPSSLKHLQVSVRVNREAQDLVPILTDLWKQKVIGMDLECSGDKEDDGLDPVSSTSRVILGQFGHPGMVYLFQPELIPFLREPLQSKRLLKLNQNIEFDFKWMLSKYKIHMVRLYCTMLAEQILRAGRDGFGVALIDLVRYHYCRIISKAVRSEFINHSGSFTEEQLYYAARDVFLLFPVFVSQFEEIKELKLDTIAQDEFRIIPAVAEMELEGVWMDTEILMLSNEYYGRELVRLKQAIITTWNEALAAAGQKATPGFFDELFGTADEEEEFDIDSTEQKLAALRRIGLTLENAQRATLKKVEHVLTKLLVEYSIVQKIHSTYGQNLIDRIHPDTGRLHPKWKQMGMGDSDSHGSREQKATIATGRMAGDFMQLPRPRDIYEEVTDPVEIRTVQTVLGKQFAAAQIKMAEELAREAKAKKAA